MSTHMAPQLVVRLDYHPPTPTPAHHVIRGLVGESGALWFVAADCASALGYPAAYRLTEIARENTELPGHIRTARLPHSKPAIHTVLSPEALLDAVSRRRQRKYADPFAAWLEKEGLPRLRWARAQGADTPSVSHEDALLQREELGTDPSMAQLQRDLDLARASAQREISIAAATRQELDRANGEIQRLRALLRQYWDEDEV